jgi:hypothetical protein
MIDKNILILKVSGNASNYAVEEQHLQQAILKYFGDVKGHEILMELNEYLIGSTLPAEGIYLWDMSKALSLLDIPVIFTDEIGKKLNVDLDNSGIS